MRSDLILATCCCLVSVAFGSSEESAGDLSAETSTITLAKGYSKIECDDDGKNCEDVGGAVHAAAQLLSDAGWELGSNFDDFKSFQKKFGVEIKPEDLERASKAYKKNIKRMERLEKELKARNATFTLRENQMMIYDDEQFKENFAEDAETIKWSPNDDALDAEEAEKLRNENRNDVEEWFKEMEESGAVKEGTESTRRRRRGVRELPESFDWRNYGVIGPVKNQGECNSCWAFTTVGLLEAKHAIKTRGKELLDLAEQHMSCTEPAKKVGTVCEPQTTPSALEFAKNGPGIGLETDAPYHTTGDMKCYNIKNPKVKVTKWMDLHGSSVDQIKDALIQNGPIAIAILFNEAFQSYGGGIFNWPCKDASMGGHAMLLVGYGSENGQPYWIIKNSWGDEWWGEKGYIRYQMGTNLCDVETRNLYQAQIA